jgi:ubiquinone biosynthesis protein COQ4
MQNAPTSASAATATATGTPKQPPLPPGWYPLRALRALRELVKNPDDTRHVFTVVESLSGHAPLRTLARFRRSASGQRLLAQRSQILHLLRDRARLEAMPEGSLAHAYLAFLDREKISADGLVQASIEGDTGITVPGSELEYVGDRLRDTHDLWHTVSGYHGDLFGEAALLAFIGVQIGNPGVALIVLTALLRARDPRLVKMVLRAIASGTRSEWLPPVEWETLLPLPLDEVRRRLKIEPVPAYETVRSADLRMLGELAPA